MKIYMYIHTVWWHNDNTKDTYCVCVITESTLESVAVLLILAYLFICEENKLVISIIPSDAFVKYTSDSFVCWSAPKSLINHPQTIEILHFHVAVATLNLCDTLQS